MDNEIDAKLPMSALQARRITDENSLTFEQICDGVKNIAKSGSGYINYMGIEIPIDVLQQLLKSGYSVGKSINPFGESVTKISW